jgi:hypothetical protein
MRISLALLKRVEESTPKGRWRLNDAFKNYVCTYVSPAVAAILGAARICSSFVADLLSKMEVARVSDLCRAWRLLVLMMMA